MSTKLDANQVIQREHDEASSSKQVTIVNSAISMELDAADGDSVLTHNNQFTASATALDNTATGVVVAEFDVDGAGVINLYSHTITTITGPQLLTLEISPTDTGDIWIATSVTATPSTTAGNVVMGTAKTDLIAKRARVSIASAITSGTFSVYVLGRSS